MVRITVAALLATAITSVIATPIEAREPRKFPSRIGAKAKGTRMCVFILMDYLC